MYVVIAGCPWCLYLHNVYIYSMCCCQILVRVFKGGYFDQCACDSIQEVICVQLQCKVWTFSR